MYLPILTYTLVNISNHIILNLSDPKEAGKKETL